jgi:hypothetical protein
MGCVPMSWVLGVIGIFVDRQKRLAITVTVITTGFLVLLFAPILLYVFCA